VSGPLRAGIVGAGAAAREIHAPAYAACEGVVLAGIAARRPDAAQALAGQFDGAAAHPSIESLLEADAVDMVSICTPPDTHRELAERAVAAGKHVLIEKPVAHTLADVAALRELAADAATVVDVVRNERYMELHRAARELVAGGAIGAVTGALLFTSTTGPDDWTGGASWPKDAGRGGGGVVLDLGVHKVDLVAWLAGAEIVEVTPALTRAPEAGEGDVEWAGALALMLAGGIPVSIATSWLGPPDAMLAILCGSEGVLQADGSTGVLTVARAGAVESQRHPAPWSPDDDSPRAMVGDFVAACRGERSPDPGTWDAGTRWVLEAYRRARSPA
jgi:UDP-N-acetylglucosamine 3-dehydrogenase